MTLFNEIDWREQTGGQIAGIEPGSLADEMGLMVGDVLLAVNDHPVNDVIDVQYYAAEEQADFLIRRDEDYLLYEAERRYNQPLGIDFTHPTFDIDIRRCNNLCEFCFVLQMPGRFRRTLYIKDDDYRYSFLFGHYVTLTNLTEYDWWRIEHMHLSPLYVSVHVTDLEMRRRFLRNAEAADVIGQLHWLAERGITMHTQLVIVPGFNDGHWLDSSLSDLAMLWPAVQSVSVVPVGLTKHHKYGMRPHSAAEAEGMLDYLEKKQSLFLSEFGKRFVYPTDEWYLLASKEVPALQAYDGHELQENGLGLVRRFLDEWSRLAVEIEVVKEEMALRFENLGLVTGTLFARILEPVARELGAMTGLRVTVIPVLNERLGETITAAGLLMASDVIGQYGQLDGTDLVVLPRVMFDHPDLISLDNMSPQMVADRLACPVALADVMGDVWDAATGRSNLIFRPQLDI